MSEKKIIAVVGATGAQGGALARAILEDTEGGFAVRAITRNPESPAARALVAAGAEVVRADADEPATLAAAFEGAHGAFLLTNFWEHFSPEREKAQAAALARAVAAAGVKHVVWSTLEDVREKVPLHDDRMPTLQGSYKVPHLDAKGESDHVFRQLGVPTTFLLTSFYWENFIGFGLGPRRGEDGALTLGLPMADAPLAGIAAEDIGRCAYGIFQAGQEMVGRTVGVAGEYLTGHEMAAQLGRALGEEVRYQPVSPAVFRSFGFPGADDLGNMFQYFTEFEADFRAARPLEESRRLNPRLQSFEGWLAQNAARIPLEPAPA